MDQMIKVGILRETKVPPDRRVPLIPSQIEMLGVKYHGVRFVVQPGEIRCYPDKEFETLNISLKEDLSECDILLGVKEIDKSTFIPGKTYLFFAHVGKKQPHNRQMFRAMAEKKVTLIDYECLTTDKGERIVAFGRWAGIVGAYNGIRAFGLKSKKFSLKPAYECHDLKEMWERVEHLKLAPGMKILVTGEGRVANGAIETLKACNVSGVSADEFLSRKFDIPVYCQIGPDKYTRHKSGLTFDFSHFISHPDEYESAFSPYMHVTDMLITGHYWDPRSPVFFTREEMKNPDFRISVIADVSCDVDGPIPSTLRATKISDPFFDYNPQLESEETPFSRPGNITVMSIDNLPGELPRDASEDFGKQLIDNVLHNLFSGTDTPVIERATILKNGKLTSAFSYLEDYLNL